MTKTERERAVAVPDLEDRRRQWFEEGVKAGAESERARIKAVEEQSMPGHEALIETLKFDGHTTGGQAALQILAAERKSLGAIAPDLRFDGLTTAPAVPTETTTRTTQQIDSSMSQEQVAAIAKREWETSPQLHHEFTGETQYVAFRKAEAAGRVRRIDKPRVQ
jgi:hypothetical protein